MASLKSDCRKFAPNIFNKTKCQNCFRGKDVHSAEALESNRATRKVCLCGYLFVAPDWDFSLPANRNKRWQRRWFVLYDDGELAYSVDECPETVPQAVIDMNCVLEVSDAESVTGNLFALAITLPERVHFIKGTSKEETKKWFEVLARFPRNTVCGKYKRNATFPGVKATIVPKNENNFTDWVNRRETVQISDYSKANSYISRNVKTQNSSLRFDPEDVIPTKDTNCLTAGKVCSVEQSVVKNAYPEANCKMANRDAYSLLNSHSGSNVNNVAQKSENRSINENVLSPSNSKSDIREVIKEKLLSNSESCKRYAKQNGKEIRKHHSRSDITPMIPSLLQEKHSNKTDWKKVSEDVDPLDCDGKNHTHNPVYVLMADVPSGKKYDSYEKFFRLDKPHMLRRQSSFGRKSDLIRQASTWSEDQVDREMRNKTIHKSASVPNAVISEDQSLLTNGSLYNRAYLSDRKAKQRLESKFLTEHGDRSLENPQERGDPDGCNLDSLQSSCSLSNENSEILSLKKGWLVKQEHSKWNKHWFVLRNSALTFYSDPIAEDAGILDGVVDLRKVQCVTEVQSNSGHTFCVAMKDSSKLYLSAVTSKMRNNWIRAILHAAKLKSEDITKKQENNGVVLQMSKEPASISLKRNPSVSSADSENVSEASLKNAVTEDEDIQDRHIHVHHHSSVALPPSPPLARTAISRVKERARSRSHSRSQTPRFGSSDVHESDPCYLADSDDGTTDHSSSSLTNAPVSLSKEAEKQQIVPTKQPEDKNKPERRRSLKLASSDVIPLPDRRKKVLEIKDKLEDSSWTIWLDVSKFCKEVDAKLDEIEKSGNKQVLPRPNGKNVDPSLVTVEKKKEIGHLVVSLMKVEKRLHKVHNELEKAKVDLLLTNKDRDFEPSIGKTISCLSSVQEAAEISGMSPQNVMLAQQLTKAKEENRRLKQDVKSSQSSCDNFELNCISLKQELKQKQDLHQSQMDLMVARVDDLTTKLLNSEKNVRQLRQRVMKLEQRQERRRSSLKGKEALSLSKEYEAKLTELEQKICAVEVALKPSEGPNDTGSEPNEKSGTNKESSNLLMRLHNLDRKVKDITEVFDQCSAEDTVKVDEFERPKICLQVKLDEDTTNQDTGEDWNSLSLSTSMTDLTNPELDHENRNQNLALSFHDCLENLNYKVSSLVSWLKTNLQLMCNENNSTCSESGSLSSESCKELKHVIRALEHALNAINNTAVITQDVNDIAKNVLYKIVLLQEVTNIVFRMSNFEKYKAAVLVQHLMRIKQTVLDLEHYIGQKSNSVSVSSPKMSLCNIVANFLFYRSSFPPNNSHALLTVEKLCDEVEISKKRVSSTIYVFKEKFLENFCATILELSENSLSDKSNVSSNLVENHADMRPLGQKQFLSHINHIITQVSHSFVTHISKSLNEIYFLCPNVQYSAKWTTHICKLLQQELIRLSTEIKSVCLKYLENDFYTGSKCGVLVEYMHCSVWELAQIVSIHSLVEGTFVLIKDAMSSTYCEQQREFQLADGENNVDAEREDLDAFHQCLLQRATSILSNLPVYPYLSDSWSFCNSSEINVAHRSVSSLLCFRQKLKFSMENERKACQVQVEQLNQKLSTLREELMKREKGGCKTCIELRQEVSYLQAELDESRALARSGSMCEKCSSLKLEIQKLMEQHERDTFMVQKLEEQEENWKRQLQDVVHERENFFSEEKKKFEKELQSAQQLLRNMENQYDEDLHNLQSLYEQKLSLPHNDVWRSRYIAEIDQLKSLCEKGLKAMEAAHKKLIAELEQKHQKEMQDLTVEREKVLAEETHATAVALEAVRKAHKDELQRQVQLFKDDFMKKMNARLEMEAFKKGYESEMSKVKHEIMAITEKYSNKCLENITLQESMEKMTEELKTSNSQIVELRTRNKQLQARLVSDTMQKLEELV